MNSLKLIQLNIIVSPDQEPIQISFTKRIAFFMEPLETGNCHQIVINTSRRKNEYVVVIRISDIFISIYLVIVD